MIAYPPPMSLRGLGYSTPPNLMSVPIQTSVAVFYI
jgi:hypothetical protein